MKKTKFNIKNIKFYALFDFLFFNFSVFLILFAWTRFLTKSAVYASIISLIILFVANLIRNRLKTTKTKKKIEQNSHKNKIENAMLSLLASDEKQNRELFLKVFSYFVDAKIEGKYIVFDKKIVAIDFTKKTIYLEDFIKLFSKIKILGKKTLIFLCYTFDAKDKIFAQNLEGISVKIVEKKDIYESLFVPSNTFPEKLFEMKKNAKLKFKQVMQMSFSRDKAKKYFLSGLLVFFCSLIVRRSIFYVLMSSVMFCFAIVSLTKKEEVITFFD